jgi:hypothetical protein
VEEELWTSQFMNSVNVMVHYVNFTKLQVDLGDPWVRDNLYNFVLCLLFVINYLGICLSIEQLNNGVSFERFDMIKVD